MSIYHALLYLMQNLTVYKVAGVIFEEATLKTFYLSEA